MDIKDKIDQEWDKKILQEKAKYLFGAQLHGLDISRCDYNKFKEWYDNSHTIECTPDIYEVACFIWDNSEQRTY